MTTASDAILTNSINSTLATDDLSIGNSQTSGVLILGNNASRTGDINIATGAGSSCDVNIRNGTGGGSIGIMNGGLTTQTTTVNIQSGTGNGTVTIGQYGTGVPAVNINGNVILQQPLTLYPVPTGNSSRLGYRSNNLATDPTTPFSWTAGGSTGQRARFFSVSAFVYIIEIRIEVLTVSSVVIMTLNQGTGTALANTRTVILDNSGGTGTISYTGIINVGGQWNVNVRSAVNPTTFNNFYIYATRIG
jgi:hypothetical protein